MKHLRNLKLLNRLFAGFYFLLGGAGICWILYTIETSWGHSFFGSIVPIALCVVLVGLGVIHWIIGGKLVEGRGRIGQTILLALNITSVPIGTAYAVYALWVCWLNGETKRVFDNPEKNLGDLDGF